MASEESDQMAVAGCANQAYEGPAELDEPGAQRSDNLRESAPTVIMVDPKKERPLSPESGEPADGAHFEISWQRLDYVVESKWYKLSSQRKPILDALSGSFKSGQLSAVLGPSGAGKSTLIDCLVGQRERGLSGRTQLSFACSADEEERRRRRPFRIATIPQEDHLLDSLTVTETFMFASKIKNAHQRHEEAGPGQKRRPFDHFANVQRVIQQLNLASCASLRCGKLSGGQYKRVSIGQELLSRPDLMILDEPTSGLDSVTCFQTVKALRQLIESSPYPIAIVVTIHQPDVEVFNLFHKAYVLAEGGRAIYEGPTDSIFEALRAGVELVERRRRLVPWQLVAGCPESDISLAALTSQLEQRDQAPLNPARLIVEVAAAEYGHEIIHALNTLQRGEPTTASEPELDAGASSSCTTGSLCSNSSGERSRHLASALVPPPCRPTSPEFHYSEHAPAHRRPDLDRLLRLASAQSNLGFAPRVYLSHLALHTRRSWLTIVRDPMLFSVQLALHVTVPLMISYAFFGRRGDACPLVGPLDLVGEAFRSEGDVLSDLSAEFRVAFENVGYMFFQIYAILFAAVCATSLTYPLAAKVLLKEYRNGWYSLSSYFLGRTLADLPVPTLNVSIAVAISYHLTGQPLSPYGWRFICVAALTVLASLVAQTQGLMFGALLMNLPQSAVFVAPASTAPLVVVSGFLVRIKSLPVLLQLLSKFSYFTYLLNGFLVARYGFNRCPCEPADFLADPDRQIPAQARGIIDLWLESFRADQEPAVNASVSLVDKLMSTIGNATTFGHQITDCSQVKPFAMLDYELQDSDLSICFAALLVMLFCFRWLTYLVLSWKINSSI